MPAWPGEDLAASLQALSWHASLQTGAVAGLHGGEVMNTLFDLVPSPCAPICNDANKGVVYATLPHHFSSLPPALQPPRQLHTHHRRSDVRPMPCRRVFKSVGSHRMHALRTRAGESHC